MSNATYSEVKTLDPATLADALYARDFSASTDAAVATTLVTNLGLASVTGLDNWVAAQLTAAGSHKGAKIVELLNGFAQMTADTTYGAYATAFNTKVDAALAASQTTGNAGGTFADAGTPVNATFTLTTGVDSIVGGAGNDTFVADNTQTNKVASVADVLVGGAGTDTLNVYGELASTPQISGIENVVLANFADGKSANFASTKGVSTVSVLDAAGAATVSVNDGVAVTITANADATKDQTVNFGSTDTSASLTLNTFKTDTTKKLAVTGTKVATLNLATTGAASTVGLLDGAAALTKLVVTGDKDLTVTDALEVTVATVDAAAFTGKLSVKTTNNTTTQDATATGGTVDLVDITINGGSGKDTIDVSANAADNEIAVNAGAGDDTLTIGAILANASASSAGDVLDGGDGTDTLVADVDLVDAVAVATALTGVSGFETLSLVGFGDANTVNVADISAGLNRVNLSAVSGAFNNTINFAAGASTVGINVAAAVAAGQSLTVDAAGTGTADSLSIVNMLTAGQMASATSDLITTDFETVTINTGTYATAAAQLVNVVNVGANTLTLTGANALTTTATNGIITAKVIDASAMTGALTMGVAAASGVTTITGGSAADTLLGDAASTINGGAGNDTITGGTGNDTLNGDDGKDTITTNTGNDTVNGGAGDDTIVIGANLTYDDVVNGGDGTDVLSITAGSVTLNSQTANVTNVETLKISDAGAQDVSFFGAATGVTTVEIGAVAGNAISGARAGLDLSVVGVQSAAYSFALATATGTADSVNVKLSSAAALTQTNALTISSVETINVTSTDTDTTAHQNTLILTASSATTVNVAGNAGTVLTATGSTAVTTFDASGVVLAAATSNGVTYTSLNTTVGAVVSITGSNGVDALTGTSQANDTINAGAGADSLTYTGGADVFTGGAGADTFVAGAGTSSIYLTVTDATIGDKIDFTAINVGAGSSAANDAALDVAAAAKITLGNAATFTNYLDAAAAYNSGATTLSAIKWFQFSGDTYVVLDNSDNTTFTSGTDSVTKLVGLVDLSASATVNGILTIAAIA
jgi:S-layer protein